MLRAKAAHFLQKFHPDVPEMAFSQGWLEKFKDWHMIKSFRHFGESGALDMEAIGAALSDIRAIVDAYAKKDVFNMDETGPLLASPSRQLVSNPSVGRPEDQQGVHHSYHLCKLGQ
jgi:hypothetical protein